MCSTMLDCSSSVDALVSQLTLRNQEHEGDLDLYLKRFAAAELLLDHSEPTSTRLPSLSSPPVSSSSASTILQLKNASLFDLSLTATSKFSPKQSMAAAFASDSACPFFLTESSEKVVTHSTATVFNSITASSAAETTSANTSADWPNSEEDDQNDDFCLSSLVNEVTQAEVEENEEEEEEEQQNLNHSSNLSSPGCSLLSDSSLPVKSRPTRAIGDGPIVYVDRQLFPSIASPEFKPFNQTFDSDFAYGGGHFEPLASGFQFHWAGDQQQHQLHHLQQQQPLLMNGWQSSATPAMEIDFKFDQSVSSSPLDQVVSSSAAETIPFSSSSSSNTLIPTQLASFSTVTSTQASDNAQNSTLHTPSAALFSKSNAFNSFAVNSMPNVAQQLVVPAFSLGPIQSYTHQLPSLNASLNQSHCSQPFTFCGHKLANKLQMTSLQPLPSYSQMANNTSQNGSFTLKTHQHNAHPLPHHQQHQNERTMAKNQSNSYPNHATPMQVSHPHYHQQQPFSEAIAFQPQSGAWSLPQFQHRLPTGAGNVRNRSNYGNNGPTFNQPKSSSRSSTQRPNHRDLTLPLTSVGKNDLTCNVDKCFEQLQQLKTETEQVSCACVRLSMTCFLIKYTFIVQTEVEFLNNHGNNNVHHGTTKSLAEHRFGSSNSCFPLTTVERLLHDQLLEYARVCSLIGQLHAASGGNNAEPFRLIFCTLQGWYSAIQLCEFEWKRLLCHRQQFNSSVAGNSMVSFSSANTSTCSSSSSSSTFANPLSASAPLAASATANRHHQSSHQPNETQLCSHVQQLTRQTRQVRTALWSSCTLLRCMYFPRPSNHWIVDSFITRHLHETFLLYQVSFCPPFHHESMCVRLRERVFVHQLGRLSYLDDKLSFNQRQSRFHHFNRLFTFTH